MKIMIKKRKREKKKKYVDLTVKRETNQRVSSISFCSALFKKAIPRCSFDFLYN